MCCWWGVPNSSWKMVTVSPLELTVARAFREVSPKVHWELMAYMMALAMVAPVPVRLSKLMVLAVEVPPFTVAKVKTLPLMVRVSPFRVALVPLAPTTSSLVHTGPWLISSTTLVRVSLESTVTQP